MGSLVKKFSKTKQRKGYTIRSAPIYLHEYPHVTTPISVAKASKVEIPSDDNEEQDVKTDDDDEDDNNDSDLSQAVTEMNRCVANASDDELRENLPMILSIVRECGRRLDIDVQKKMHEYIYAHKHGLKVSTAQGGADLQDKKTGRKYEHKSMKLDVDSNMCNVNIVIPTRPAKISTAAYAQLVYAHVLAKGDVLIEARNVEDASLDYEVEISAAFIARYAKEYIEREISKKRLTKFNIGGRACRTCNRVHRLDRLVEDSENFDNLTDKDWGKIVSRQVPYKCDLK